MHRESAPDLAVPKRPSGHWLPHRAGLRRRGRLLSAISVLLAASGCAPPGARTPEQDVEPLRRQLVQPHGAGRLSYLQAGDPRGPRVILIHGTPGTATAWADYLHRPPQGLEIIAIDRPGNGRSDPSGAEPSLQAQGLAVQALLPTDGRRTVLLGHSLGGAVAAWVAAREPERVQGLVLLAASLDPQLETVHPLQTVGDWAPVRSLLSRTLRNANAELLALRAELDLLAPRLATIRARVEIVHGTQDDLVPVANVDYMRKRLSGASCLATELLDGRNHFLPWNSEHAVRAAIARALEGAC
jgi:pimeloyl-ACP methyl ester carboxylesterase